MIETVDSVVPIDVYVAGCPPRPDEIINAVVTCLNLLKEDAAHGGKEWRQKKPVSGGVPKEITKVVVS
jgi:NADH:ubiquinone oxidoreductase subunit B-like Fe-S oxidoreductase